MTIFRTNFIFAICTTLFYFVFRMAHHNFAKAMLIIILHIVFVVNCVYVGLLHETGFEFGPTVLLHISWSSVMIAVKEFALILVLLLIIFIPITAIMWKKFHFNKGLTLVLSTLSILALTANSMVVDISDTDTRETLPIYSLLKSLYQFNETRLFDDKEYLSNIQYTKQEQEILENLGLPIRFPSFDLDKLRQPSIKPNLILVYLESYQRNFTKNGGWQYAPLTPELDKLEHKFTIYDNFYNSITPTINAVVTTLCGTDIFIGESPIRHQHRDSINDVLKENSAMSAMLEQSLVCLPDILSEMGYHQVFMKGAPIEFSGKKYFLQSHHYDELLGLTEFNATQKYSHNLNLWGLQDIDLFDEAINKLTELKDKQPFNLSLLTVNSHAPGFTDPRCPIYVDNNTLINGIHCTDFAVGNFIRKLESHGFFDNSIIVLIGDHMLFDTVNVKDMAGDKLDFSWYGKTYLAVHSPYHNLPDYDATVGVSEDLAPTILELLGIQNAKFISGKSLLSTRKKFSHIVTMNYELKESKQYPAIIKKRTNTCSKKAIKETIINETSGPFTECQRAKIYAAKQRLLFH